MRDCQSRLPSVPGNSAIGAQLLEGDGSGKDHEGLV